MSTWIERLHRDEGGFGVISAVIVGFVVTAGAITMLSLSVHQNEASAQERDRERAFAAAEAAISEAMNMMSFDAAVCPGLNGEPVATGSLPGGGEYEFQFVAPEARFACSNPLSVDRYIVARAWAPSRTAPQAQRRQVEQQIKLKPLGGFKYALFASPGGIVSGNNMTVNGDIYSALDLAIAQQSKVFGDVTGQQLVSVDNNSIVSGDIWARGDVTLTSAGSLVQGDVKTSGGDKIDTSGNVIGTYAGNISNTGTIEKKALAPGSITGTEPKGGKVIGPVKAPPRRALPDFDPTLVPYNMTHASATDFYDHWLLNRTDFSGVHRVFGSGAVLFEPFSTTTRSDQTTMVVADGPIQLSRDVKATGAGVATFVLISTAVSTETSLIPSILLSNLQKFPPNASIVLFAPNGCIEFRNLKQFTGTVYAKCLKMDNNFTITYLEPPPLPGFDWSVAASTRFLIESYTFREVAFQP